VLDGHHAGLARRRREGARAVRRRVTRRVCVWCTSVKICSGKL
jgi:hypothetical protein